MLLKECFSLGKVSHLGASPISRGRCFSEEKGLPYRHLPKNKMRNFSLEKILIKESHDSLEPQYAIAGIKWSYALLFLCSRLSILEK